MTSALSSSAWDVRSLGKPATLGPSRQAAAHVQRQGSRQGHGRDRGHRPPLADGWASTSPGLLPGDHPRRGPDRLPQSAQHPPETPVRTRPAILLPLQRAPPTGFRRGRVLARWAEARQPASNLPDLHRHHASANLGRSHDCGGWRFEYLISTGGPAPR